MEAKKEGALIKNFHLPPQTIEGKKLLGYQILMDLDSPLDTIQPNVQAEEERKPQTPVRNRNS